MLCSRDQAYRQAVASKPPKSNVADGLHEWLQGAVVTQLQAELQSCRDQMSAQVQAVAAMVAERDAARASASDSAERAKVLLRCNISILV